MKKEHYILPEEENEGQLAIDVRQTPSAIIIESAVAGVDPDDLDIDIAGDSVTIRGERRHEDEITDQDYLFRECYWGKFSRSIILPEEIDPEKSEANFENGLLRIELPRIQKSKAKKIKPSKKTK